MKRPHEMIVCSSLIDHLAKTGKWFGSSKKCAIAQATLIKTESFDCDVWKRYTAILNVVQTSERRIIGKLVNGFFLSSICNENRSLKTRQDFVPKWSHIYIMSQETSAVAPSTAETGPNAIERLSRIIFVVMLIKSIDMQLVLRTLKDTKPNHIQVVHSDVLCLFSVEKKFA